MQSIASIVTRIAFYYQLQLHLAGSALLVVGCVRTSFAGWGHGMRGCGVLPSHVAAGAVRTLHSCCWVGTLDVRLSCLGCNTGCAVHAVRVLLHAALCRALFQSGLVP
jgi:hypothetical protein